jgi:hypothetical protein
LGQKLTSQEFTSIQLVPGEKLRPNSSLALVQLFPCTAETAKLVACPTGTVAVAGVNVGLVAPMIKIVAKPAKPFALAVILTYCIAAELGAV